MAGRIIEVCEAVKDLIRSKAGGQATVVRTWRPKVDRDKVTGRKVFVYAESYGDTAILSREEDEREYRVVVQICEKCEEQVLTDVWVDGLVAWTEETVLDPMRNLRDAPLLGTLMIEEPRVAVVCDYDLLDSHRVFESVLTFAFREDATPS